MKAPFIGFIAVILSSYLCYFFYFVYLPLWSERKKQKDDETNTHLFYFIPAVTQN